MSLKSSLAYAKKRRKPQQLAKQSFSYSRASSLSLSQVNKIKSEHKILCDIYNTDELISFLAARFGTEEERIKECLTKANPGT